MKLFIIFLLFFFTEYMLRSYVEAYTYHSTGLFLEFLPLMLDTFLAVLIYKTDITKGRFAWIYLQLVAVSILGLFLVETFLYIQWYWFIAPQYREVPGDMMEGLGFSLFFFILGCFVILFSYALLMWWIKSRTKKTSET